MYVTEAMTDQIYRHAWEWAMRAATTDHAEAHRFAKYVTARYEENPDECCREGYRKLFLAFL
jgi:hypothetical protein